MTRLTGILFILIATAFILQHEWYLKNPRWKADENVTKQLGILGDSALLSLDVPVAAVLMYKEQIIGRGYNTVRRDNAAGGHAEINAISDAIKPIGLDSFMRMDRDKLVLITTWEPCYMCQGAIVEYNIRHVTALKTKSVRYWFNEWKKQEQYEWNKRAATSDTLQEALFKKHPAYNLQKQKGGF